MVILCNAARVANDDSTSSSINSPINSQLLLKFSPNSLLQTMAVKAVILVGGETTGTRFRPLTMDFDKCLFPVAGQPLLSHIITKLKSDLGNDLDEIFLISFFKDPVKFETYIKEAKSLFPGVKLSLLTEPTPMGTGGGIFYFKDKILGLKPDSSILLIHGDVVCDYPFKELVSFQSENDADVTILGIDPPVLLKDRAFHGLDKEQVLRRYGTLFSNKQSHKVVHYVEKPKSDSFAKFVDTDYLTSINGGVYAFKPTIFDLLEEAKAKKLSSEPFPSYDVDDQEDPYYPNILSFELDIFKTLPGKEELTFLNFPYTQSWYQLTNPVFALAANAFLLKKDAQPSTSPLTSPVKILSDLKLDGSKIGPDVSIGKNVKIGSGVRLRNCIICDGVEIGDHSVIVNAIISRNVVIGKWCRIEGTLNNPVLEASLEHSSKLLSNMVILCKDTTVGNQVFVYNSVVLPHKELRGDVKYEIVM